jgi:hypothetical protein
MMHLLIALLCPLLVLQADVDPPAEDGIYRITDDVTAPAVTTVDGSVVRLGPRYVPRPLGVDLHARDNANTRFSLTVDVPWDAELAGDLRTVLIVGGVAYRQSGGGASGRERSHLSFRVTGLTAAQEVGRFFDATPRVRRHPGHRLRVGFKTDPAPTRPGERVEAVLQLTNVGTEPVKFVQGGRNRAARDNQFVFSATWRGEQVRNVGTSMHMGGLATHRVIAPGETFELAVELTKWFAFDQPGHYEVLGSYFMELAEPDDDTWHTLWDHYATASFTVTVEDAPRTR